MMNDCKASVQNFDSTYIYKVEKREESEKIVCHSDRGLMSIEHNELPKVTRYFLKNDKGVPQGYIERKLILNFNPDITGDDDKFDPQNCTSDNGMLHKENTKIGSNATLKSGKNFNKFRKMSKRFHPSHELNSPLNSSAFERCKNNSTFDCPSSNSIPSERTFNINHSAIERNIKRQPTQEKSVEKMADKKSQRLFCNDPNKRLKNLFTIIKHNEKITESAKVPRNAYDVDLLNKTKDFLIKLIDEELDRIQPNESAPTNVILHHGNMIDKHDLKKLKLKCIGKIEEELKLMKTLPT